jgi:hypothetical protein
MAQAKILRMILILRTTLLLLNETHRKNDGASAIEPFAPGIDYFSRAILSHTVVLCLMDCLGGKSSVGLFAWR